LLLWQLPAVRIKLPGRLANSSVEGLGKWAGAIGP